MPYTADEEILSLIILIYNTADLCVHNQFREEYGLKQNSVSRLNLLMLMYSKGKAMGYNLL